MINNTPAEYLFIRVCILFLDNIVPAALGYCFLAAASTLIPQLARFCYLPRPILAWLVVEVAFNLLIFRPRFRILRQDAIHPELVSREEREKLFHRCHRHIPDPEAYLSNWFGGASQEDIKRENVKEFLRWAFLDMGQVREEYEEEIESYTRRTEDLLGRRLLEGRGSAKSLRLTLDKIKFGSRSFLWYMCVAVVDTLASSRLWWQGFQLHHIPFARFFDLFPFRPLMLLSRYESPATHLSYWYRPHTSKTKLPILFVHGIGIGLYPYTNFLHELKANSGDSDDGEVGIIALEIMPISFRITHSALSKDVMVAEIQSILKHHGWEKVVLITHSYGSTIATHLIKSPSAQQMIGPVVFIDPITFLLHLPGVAHNFTVRRPVQANEHQLSYFGSQDMGVAHTLGRRFFWSENIMWVEDLGLGAVDGQREVSIVMAGRDLIVDTKTVSRYLLSPNAISRKQPSEMNGYATENVHDGYQNGRPVECFKEDHVGITKRIQGEVPTVRSKTEGEWKCAAGKSPRLKLLWFEQLDHAQVFDSAKSRKPVVETIRKYVMGKSDGLSGKEPW